MYRKSGLPFEFAANPEKYNDFIIVNNTDVCKLHESEGWEMVAWLGRKKAIMQRPLNEKRQRYYDVAVAALIVTGKHRYYLQL